MLPSVENDGQSDIQHFLGKYTIKFQMLYALNGTKKQIKFSSEIVANSVPNTSESVTLASKKDHPILGLSNFIWCLWSNTALSFMRPSHSIHTNSVLTFMPPQNFATTFCSSSFTRIS